ncbi:5-hydroxytryptamine receptor 3A-like [Pyxicephalus adspersus]|uniref:5-hydroxytryptamine receptor 3A-like n=1 Tax=Pyxicephalus adspersus TaxID=30357 RepID=UPI003B58C42A
MVRSPLVFTRAAQQVEEVNFMSLSNSTKVFEELKKKYFTPKGDWNLINITVFDYLDKGDTNYSRVIYTITIERVSEIYVLTFVMPVCFMVLLDMFSMFIQMDKADRLGFKITLILGFAMLLLILKDILPLSETPPLLGACQVPARKEKINLELEEKKSDTEGQLDISLEVKLLNRLMPALLKINKSLIDSKKKNIAKLQCSLAASTCLGEYPCSYNDLVQNLSAIDETSRPVNNWLTATNVTIDLTLYTVIHLDTSLQSLTTLVWLNMAWDSEFKTWDPAMNCGIKSIFVTGDNLWKPDLYIYERTENDDKSPAIPYFNISYKGKIINAKPLQIVSSCKLDIYKFPFDTQKCNITFGSYNYPEKDLVMVPRSNSSMVYKNTDDVFVRKGDWILLNISANSNVVFSEGINYTTVYYEITLKRVPVVYIVTLILPACLMVILDLFSMFIPMGSEERLNFKITIVLGFSVLLLILNNMLPTSYTPPILGIFCLVCMAVMVFSIIGCITISYMLMLSESQKNVPRWVKTWILTYLAKLLCFKSFSKNGINIGEPDSVTCK